MAVTTVPSSLNWITCSRADQRVDERLVFLGLLNGTAHIGTVALDMRQPTVTPFDRAPGQVEPGQAGIAAQVAVVVSHRFKALNRCVKIAKAGQVLDVRGNDFTQQATLQVLWG